MRRTVVGVNAEDEGVDGRYYFLWRGNCFRRCAVSRVWPLVSRRLIFAVALDSHHEVAGFIFGTVGVIYAVLLAFVGVVVWEELENAKVAVSSEANHLANIGRLADLNGWTVVEFTAFVPAALAVQLMILDCALHRVFDSNFKREGP